MTTINAITERALSVRNRSAWARGVAEYTAELLETLSEAVEGGYFDTADLGNVSAVRKALLNGAENWAEYSHGGCALCYDTDIARRLCAPWELRRTRNGQRNPNSRENWLDVQSRALYQAAERICEAVRELAADTRAESVTVVTIIPPVLPVAAR